MNISLRKLLNRIQIKTMQTRPASTNFGFDRGLPVDRYYIEKFLSAHSSLITGDVVEVGECVYTMKFGHKVNKKMALHYDIASNKEIIADLATGKGISEGIADCFIITQTYQFIFDVNNAVKNSLKLLKENGVLLATVPGITPISPNDYDSWGHYWAFTDMSLRKLFEQHVASNCIETFVFGNVKTASAFLYGFACEELNRKELDYFDKNYPVIIGIKVTK